MEADYRDETIQSFAQNILRLGNECRALAEENARLKEEKEGYKHTSYSIGLLQDKLTQKCQDYFEVRKQNEANVQLIRDLKAENEVLKGQVLYWKVEAECDHGRWLRCLEDLEHLRRLK